MDSHGSAPHSHGPSAKLLFRILERVFYLSTHNFPSIFNGNGHKGGAAGRRQPPAQQIDTAAQSWQADAERPHLSSCRRPRSAPYGSVIQVINDGRCHQPCVLCHLCASLEIRGTGDSPCQFPILADSLLVIGLSATVPSSSPQPSLQCGMKRDMSERMGEYMMQIVKLAMRPPSSTNKYITVDLHRHYHLLGDCTWSVMFD